MDSVKGGMGVGLYLLFFVVLLASPSFPTLGRGSLLASAERRADERANGEPSLLELF